MPETAPPSTPYLADLYAPVDREIESGPLPVEGELPADLRGFFLRNSPNPRFPPLGRYHWFDGDGMIHAVELGDRGPRYRNRWIRTRGFQLEEAQGRALWGGISDPIDLFNPHGPLKNTANTDLVFHAGRLLALWWLGQEPYEVRLPDLETVGPWRYGGRLETGLAAHAKVDEHTGEMMFFDYSVVCPPYLRYGVVSAAGDAVRVLPIELPGPRLLHDLAISEHYTILLDLPLTWDAEALRQGQQRPVFDARLPSRFGILPRHGNTAPRWFEASPCYIFHTINAHEEGEEVVLLGCRIENPLCGTEPGPGMPSIGPLRLAPYLHRWRFHLGSGAVREEQLDDVPSEFPRTNNQRLGRPARYCYNPRIARGPRLLFDGVIKYDVAGGRAWTAVWGEGRYGGEVVFAPRPGATAEDDGWLLTFVTDARDGRSELVVLDARDVELEPVARIALPARVPMGFHAAWVPAEKLGRG